MVRWLIYPLVALALILAPGAFLPADMNMAAAATLADAGAMPEETATEQDNAAPAAAMSGKMDECGTCGPCMDDRSCDAQDNMATCDKTCRTACSSGSLPNLTAPDCAISAHLQSDRFPIPEAKTALHLVPSSDPPPPRL
jgi:hypothetical protein